MILSNRPAIASTGGTRRRSTYRRAPVSSGGRTYFSRPTYSTARSGVSSGQSALLARQRRNAQIAQNQSAARQRTRAHYATLKRNAIRQRMSRIRGTASVGARIGNQRVEAKATGGYIDPIALRDQFHQNSLAEQRLRLFERTPMGQVERLKDFLGTLGQRNFGTDEYERGPLGAAVDMGQNWLRTGPVGRAIFGAEQVPLWGKTQSLLGGRMPHLSFANLSDHRTAGGGQVAAYVPGLGRNQVVMDPREIKLGTNNILGAIFGGEALGPAGGGKLTLHEWAHTRQSPQQRSNVITGTGAPTRKAANYEANVEGGAETFAQDVAPTIYKELGWGYRPSGQSPEYGGYQRDFGRLYGPNTTQQALMFQFPRRYRGRLQGK